MEILNNLDLQTISATEKFIALITAVLTLIAAIIGLRKELQRRNNKKRIEKLRKEASNITDSFKGEERKEILPRDRKEAIFKEIGFKFEILKIGKDESDNQSPELRFIKAKISVNKNGYFELYHNHDGNLQPLLPRCTNCDVTLLIESEKDNDFDKIIRFGQLKNEKENLIYELIIKRLTLNPRLVEFSLGLAEERELRSLSINLTKDRQVRPGHMGSIYLKE